jgi:hypothetical protein
MNATIASHTIELLRCVLPPLSPVALQVIMLIANQSDRVGSEDLFARRAGLLNRHTLARAFKREGLPTTGRLAAWIRVLSWVLEWEEEGVSISALALRRCQEPAAYYRTIKRVTGHTWRELQPLGSPWVLLQIEHECHSHARHLTTAMGQGRTSPDCSGRSRWQAPPRANRHSKSPHRALP